MTPNYALSLSSDGIALLRKSSAGWRKVGDADPSSEDFAEQLGMLRRTATALSPEGLRCKLIIPNDQIRYLEIDTPGKNADERRAAARAALDGATPYVVDELVFDIHVDLDRTCIAAVARETLEEAEAFALQHRMAPICFCAWPAEGSGFRAEPFFGQTAAAASILPAGEEVERDSAPLMLTAGATAATSDPSSLPDEGLAERTEDPAQDEGTDATDLSFVSRRRVPTFRSRDIGPDAYSAASAGTVPGFGEPQTPFEGAAPRAARITPVSPQRVPAPAPIVRKTTNDAERMTVYGAQTGRRAQGRLGIGAALALLAIMVALGIASFAGGAANNGLWDFFARMTSPKPTAQFTAPLQPQVPITEVVARADDTDLETTAPATDLALLDTALTDEDAAVLDALRAPVIEAPSLSQVPEVEDQSAAYAASGIWPVAPEVPTPPGLVDLDDLYVTSIDPISQNFDAVALPALSAQDHDLNFRALPPPAPAGTTFELDARGMVVATRNGAMNPDGIMVFAGAPPARPPGNLVKAEAPGVDLSERIRLAAFRPRSRPANLIETSERAAFSGLTRSELAEIRPRLRPQSAQEDALASASLVSLNEGNSRSLLEQPESTDFENATARAIVASLRPDARPRDFEQIVAKAVARAPAPAPASTASVAPRAVTPKIPTNASVSREATEKNAINLRRVNLIGVYGKPSNRRALVRLDNGSYRKVEVGDRLDGGRVSAIGDAELRYQKSGRSIVLTMPRG